MKKSNKKKKFNFKNKTNMEQFDETYNKFLMKK